MLDLLLSVYLTAQPIDSVPTESFLREAQHIELSSLPSVANTAPVQLSATSALAVDVKSNTKLIDYHSNERLPMASLTKIMTALIIAENHKLDEVVTVSKNAVQTEGSRIYLNTGEQMTVENLLKGLLIKSGNDTATALAEFHSGSVKNFVEAMNERAKSLNMKNTHFMNPHGLDEKDHYSSAADLLILTQAFWKNDFLRQVVNTKEASIYSLTEGVRSVQNTNQLLGDEIHGVKTGTTDAAGECLILNIQKDGKEIFTIVLGSKNRYTDSKKFIEDIFANIR